MPEPAAGHDQVLVDVRAAGVNFPDVLQTQGLYQYKPDLPFALGSEVAGVVRAGARTGSGRAPATGWPRSRASGAFAEVVAVPADSVLPLPDEVSFSRGRRPADELPDRALRAAACAGGCSRARRCWCTARRAGWARRSSSWPPRWARG